MLKFPTQSFRVMSVVPTSDLTARLADAHKAAREFDWANWQIAPDDFLPGITREFADQPMVTRRSFQAYLSLCAWVWQRPLAPAEQQHAFDQLTQKWNTFIVEQGYTNLYNLVALVFLLDGLQTAPPLMQEAVRLDLARLMPTGLFPGLDMPSPGADTETKKRPTRRRTDANIALDGLYQGTTFGLQLNVLGPPGSGTWGSQTEIYAFFPDGRYVHFQSAQSAGALVLDPQSQHGAEGTYEISGGYITLTEDGGEPYASDFTATADLKEIKFYGKVLIWIGDSASLRR